MVSVGEQTGKIDQSLRRAAERYDKELDKDLQRIMALIMPAVLIVMALPHRHHGLPDDHRDLPDDLEPRGEVGGRRARRMRRGASGVRNRGGGTAGLRPRP